MARTEIPIVVLDPATGNAISGASVLVKIRSSGATATVYAAETGGGTLANPLSSDANGRVTGWVERGAYNATISGTGISTYTEAVESAPGADGAVDAAWLASGVLGGYLATPGVTGKKITWGTFSTSLSTEQFKDTTITHGLGGTPDVVVAISSNNIVAISLQSKTSTQAVLRTFVTSNTTQTLSIAVYWVAIG